MMAQREVRVPQYSVHGFTNPENSLVSSFQLSRNNRIPNPHLPKQNWTTVTTNVKSFCPSFTGTKGSMEAFPFKKVRQNMVLQGYVPYSMFLSYNLKQIFDPSDTTVSYTA